MKTVDQGMGNGLRFSSPVLDMLADKLVFMIRPPNTLSDGNVTIMELCDDYYIAALSEAQLRALAADLLRIADSIDASPNPEQNC